MSESVAGVVVRGGFREGIVAVVRGGLREGIVLAT